MSRTPDVYQKTVTSRGKRYKYWASSAGGRIRYLGRCDKMTKKDAREKLYRETGDAGGTALRKRINSAGGKGYTVAEAIADYLVDIKPRVGNYKTYRCYLRQWQRHRVSSKLYGQGQRIEDLPVAKIAAEHLDEFLLARTSRINARTGQPYADADQFVKYVKTFLRFCERKKLVAQCPIKGTSRWRAPITAPVETDLPSPKEVKALMSFADKDTEPIRGGGGIGQRWRKRAAGEQRPVHNSSNFGDFLRMLHHTGARPKELCYARVSDFSPRNRQITLRQWKGASSTGRVRQVLLNSEALQIVEAHCAGKAPLDFIFTRPLSGHWQEATAQKRFREVRALAKVRDSITLYSFRHLYISELLLAGESIAQVAKLAGTSVRMIEKHYGHFFHHDLTRANDKLLELRKTLGSVG